MQLFAHRIAIFFLFLTVVFSTACSKKKEEDVKPKTFYEARVTLINVASNAPSVYIDRYTINPVYGNGYASMYVASQTDGTFTERIPEGDLKSQDQIRITLRVENCRTKALSTTARMKVELWLNGITKLTESELSYSDRNNSAYITTYSSLPATVDYGLRKITYETIQ